MIRTFRKIKALVPNADFHVFSSIVGEVSRRAHSNRRPWVSKQFDPIRRFGAKVHLDDERRVVGSDASTDAALLHRAARLFFR